MVSEHNTKTAMMTMAKKQNKTLQREQKPLLLHSVLRYLQKNAFSKTLKRFLSEAQIENDNWKASSLDLEDLYWEYLHKCSHDDTNFNTNEEQELRTDGTIKKDRNSNYDTSKETIKRENKKRNDERNSNGVADQSAAAGNFFTESVTESKVISKEKKKNKRSADCPGQTEHVKSDVFKKLSDETAREVQIDESTKKHNDRKKKKSNAESSMSNVELLQGVNEEKSQDLPSSLCNTKADYEADVKPKEKKKKKKRSTNSLVENVEHCGLANKLGMITDSLLSDSTLGNTFDIPLEEKKIKSKDKQGKKEGSVSEKLSSGFVEVLDQESPIIIDSGNERYQPSEDAVKKDKKSSKKRKRLASDENEYQLVEGEAIEESICRTKSLEEAKNKDQLTKGDGAIERTQNNGQVGQNETHKSSSKYLDEHANGNLEKNGGDEFPVQKTTKKQRYGSSEPKTQNAFQRVKIDEVVFADEKLQDNSYWAKNGAEVGYGAKAQEILGQVRGRDFRHEKTKKKRGSYRGGQIDLHSHSIKFNYSDED